MYHCLLHHYIHCRVDRRGVGGYQELSGGLQRIVASQRGESRGKAQLDGWYPTYRANVWWMAMAVLQRVGYF